MISENYCNFKVVKIKSLQTIITVIIEDKEPLTRNLSKTSRYRRQKHLQKKRRWLQSLPKPSPYNSWPSWRLNDASWPGNYPSVAPSSLWFQIPDGLENTSHLPKFLRPPQKNLKLTNSPSVTVFRKILLMSLSLLLILSDSGRDVMRMTE